MKNKPLAGGVFRVITAILLATSCWSPGADWTQYRGPNHDGIATDRILSSGSRSSPPVRWRVPFQFGYSSFTASRGRVFTKDRRTVGDQAEEFCLALDADTGAELWSVPVGASVYFRPLTTTPILDGDRVYVVTTESRLSCLSMATGQILWARDLAGTLFDQTGAITHTVGSPTVEGDWVFTQTGGAMADLSRLIALRKTDGELAWMIPAEAPTYATPIAATIQGVRQVIFSTASGLISVAPGSGEILWRFPCRCAYATPVVSEDIVITYHWEGASAMRISLVGGAFAVSNLWSLSSRLLGGGSTYTTPVCYQGFLYGIRSGNSLNSNDLVCVDIVSGKIQWEQPQFHDSGILIVDAKLLTFSSAPQLVLAEANPAKFVRLASFPISGLTSDDLYNHPAVHNSRIYARSTTFGVCLDFAVDRPAVPIRSKWEFLTYMNGANVPAIGADGTVYFGARDQQVYAMDGKTGAQKWAFMTRSAVSSSPALGPDGTVYVGSDDHSIYALDGTTGAKKWAFATGDAVRSSPAIGAQGTVYVGSFDHKVYALNGSTGAKLWDFTTLAPVASSPAIGTEGTVYIGSNDQRVYALDGTTGVKKWAFAAHSQVSSSPALGLDGTVYVGAMDGTLYALDRIDGTAKWEAKLGSSFDASVAIGRDGMLFVAGSSNTTVQALDPATGAVKWGTELADTLDTCPVVGADGTIYVVSMNARIFALDGATGIEIWELKLRSLSSDRSSLALGAVGSLYTACGGKLDALEGGSPGGLMSSPWPAPRGNARNTGQAIAALRPDDSNVVASNFVGLVLHPVAGAALELQSADTLENPLDWRSLADIPSSTTPRLFIDPTAPNRGRRFYRATGTAPLGIGLFPGWTFTAPVGSRYRIEYTEPRTSPTNWQFLTNLTLTNSPCLFIDTTATNRAPRSYRTSPLD